MGNHVVCSMDKREKIKTGAAIWLHGSDKYLWGDDGVGFEELKEETAINGLPSNEILAYTPPAVYIIMEHRGAMHLYQNWCQEISSCFLFNRERAGWSDPNLEKTQITFHDHFKSIGLDVQVCRESFLGEPRYMPSTVKQTPKRPGEEVFHTQRWVVYIDRRQAPNYHDEFLLEHP